MPICYNKELGGWEAVDLTEEEKQNLVDIAMNFIADNLGETVADRIMETFSNKTTLTDTPKEEMGQA